MKTIKIEQPYAWLVVTNQINEVWVERDQEEELKSSDNDVYVAVYATKDGAMAWALEKYIQERQKGVWHCPKVYDQIIGKVMIKYIFYDENLDLLHVVFEYNTGIRKV